MKLRGARASAKGNEWLLLKEKDAAARTGEDVTALSPDSVATGRDLDEIARDRDRTWHSNRAEAKARPVARRSRPVPDLGKAQRRAAPKEMRPQLATLAASAPAGDEWLHEMKLDGYRILARLGKKDVRLWTRAGKDWTARFPDVARELLGLGGDGWIDGELAVLMPDGTTSFAAMQNAQALPEGARLVYFAFDLLHWDGRDLRGLPLEERKRALEAMLPASDTLRYSQHVAGDGTRFFAEACRLALEGVISKRRAAPYRAGRGTDWLKVKCVREQEVVIGGFTEPKGAREGIGALLVGVYDASGTLHYAGKVGTGFGAAAARDLRRRLEALVRATRAFAASPGIPRATCVEPWLVAQVRFTEWTRDGRLRHPAFVGLREDKEAREVTREQERPAPKAAPAARAQAGKDATARVAGVRISSPERVVFAEAGITKERLARYYEQVADAILPHLADRPLSLVRCPEGAGGECFYVKHAGPWTPRDARRVRIQEKTKQSDYVTVDSVSALVGLVQMGTLELHTWNARSKDLERPDRVVFDLDPAPDVPWKRVTAAAREVRERLERLDLDCWLKTTGGKGLHVVVPLAPKAGWDDCWALSQAVADAMERDAPRDFVTDMAKSKRAGRIFIDTARNRRGSTSVSAFSTRARPAGPVSMPLSWDELVTVTSGAAFDLETAEKRAAAADPWRAYGKTRQSIGPARLKKAQSL